jgi:hypothetical protein
MVQATVDKLLDNITLADLSNSEKETEWTFKNLIEENSN